MPIAKIGDINIRSSIQGTREPIVMIMGFGSARGRGVGGSEKPQGPFTTRMIADDVIRLLDYLEIEKIHIIVASMGA